MRAADALREVRAYVVTRASIPLSPWPLLNLIDRLIDDTADDDAVAVAALRERDEARAEARRLREMLASAQADVAIARGGN